MGFTSALQKLDEAHSVAALCWSTTLAALASLAFALTSRPWPGFTHTQTHTHTYTHTNANTYTHTHTHKHTHASAQSTFFCTQLTRHPFRLAQVEDPAVLVGWAHQLCHGAEVVVFPLAGSWKGNYAWSDT
jgi:hypothetical protein